MSLRTQPHPTSVGEEAEPDAISAAPETVLELINDGHVREMLKALQDGPKPACDLVKSCEASRPTVYRRLNRLENAGLVKSRTAIHPDGHHRKEFVTDFESVTLEIGGGAITVSVTATE